MNTAEFKTVKYILMDIEGTTSDINFVKNVLFPYSAKELRNYIGQYSSDQKVKDCLGATGKHTDDDAIALLLQWIKDDVKHPALKTLQGLIWRRGYEEGVFTSHLYDDVLPAWKEWKKAGLTLGIYSSGSVAAQKLLFGYTKEGSVLNYLSNYFDLEVGGKREEKSYARISDLLKIPPSGILFLSDIPEELDAAKASGFKVAHIVRSGTQSVPKYQSYSDFSEL